MPTITVDYDRDEEDIRRIAVDSDHPLESPYRQACIKWVEEHPAPPSHPRDFPIGTVFTHTTGTRPKDTAEYVKLYDATYLRTSHDGERSVRFRSDLFWRLRAIEIVFQP